MNCADGSDIQVGDVMEIATKYRGEIIASMDNNDYAAGKSGGRT